MESYVQFMPAEAAWDAGPLVLLGLWALANCLAGYFLFRALLVVNGAVVGVAVGAALAQWLRPVPTTMDYVIACGGAAILLALAAWLLWRMAFAIVALAGVAGAVAAAGDGGDAAWILGGVLGLAVAVAFFFAARMVIIALTGLWGGWVAVGAVAGLLAGAGWMLPGWVLLLAAAVLAVLGMNCQVKLSRTYRSGLTPERKRSSSGGTEVHPRFTRI